MAISVRIVRLDRQGQHEREPGVGGSWLRQGSAAIRSSNSVRKQHRAACPAKADQGDCRRCGSTHLMASSPRGPFAPCAGRARSEGCRGWVNGKPRSRCGTRAWECGRLQCLGIGLAAEAWIEVVGQHVTKDVEAEDENRHDKTWEDDHPGCP